MTHPAPRKTNRLPLGMPDLRGLTRLGFEATDGVMGMVEQMHRTIGAVSLPLGRGSGERTTGVTGLVYRIVRGSTRLASRSTDAGLRLIETLLPPPSHSPEREAVLAAINGIWGDHLEATANPLTIPTTLHLHGQALDLETPSAAWALPDARRRVAILIHGLCMNPLQWQRNGHDHGAMLEHELGYSVLHLHYNSGLPIAENGARLATLLDRLLARWPLALERLVLVGHSMGGLVARSACHEAEAQGLPWRSQLTRIVCLGTPHLGARLERAGQRLDQVLELSPYIAPFARLAKMRSAGINDLRHGNILRDAVKPRAAARRGRGEPRTTPLPAGVEVNLLAATTANRPAGFRHALVGDGLVTLASAWGEHRNPARNLGVPASHKALITHANHWDLLDHPEAAAHLARWLE